MHLLPYENQNHRSVVDELQYYWKIWPMWPQLQLWCRCSLANTSKFVILQP